MHTPIHLKNIGLSFSNKLCFEDFSIDIISGDRIAIIGRNGSGKSSLLDIIRQTTQPTEGEVLMPEDIQVSHVAQTIDDLDHLSGGQRFNKKLTQALAQDPDVLLLDEPTNHLDWHNRKSLMHMLQRYAGTLIVVTHDTELLRQCVDTLWHIDSQSIHVFSGEYDDYMRDIKRKQASLEKERASLKRDRKGMHETLMKEQKRAAHSKAKGKKSIQQKKWPTVVSLAKASRAEKTSGKKKAAMDRKKQELTDQLSKLRLPEMIVPTFSLTADKISSEYIVSIHHADIGYHQDEWVLKNISLCLGGHERIAVYGKNASGKSTLLKALLKQEQIVTTGRWHLPHQKHVGYLDQHYSNLNPSLSVMEHIKALREDWDEVKVRRHLNDFLFKDNEQVPQLAAHLSGGEKARASLSLIAAKTPRVLILDEITNNLDLETKEHVIQVLKEYPGAMIIVSHEEDFINAIGIDRSYTLDKGCLR